MQLRREVRARRSFKVKARFGFLARLVSDFCYQVRHPPRQGEVPECRGEPVHQERGSLDGIQAHRENQGGCDEAPGLENVQVQGCRRQQSVTIQCQDLILCNEIISLFGLKV